MHPDCKLQLRDRGFCAEIASNDWFNAPYNLYDGDTQERQPALGAGCNEYPGSFYWDFGESFFYGPIVADPSSVLYQRYTALCR